MLTVTMGRHKEEKLVVILRLSRRIKMTKQNRRK